MKNRFRIAGILVLLVMLFASCSRVPKAAKYIPKDALSVVGIHTGKLRRELAWSAIMGSGLLNELRKDTSMNKLPDALKDLDQSGIDFGATLYGFTRPDQRFPGRMKMAAVLPLADKGKLEAYLKKHFPSAALKKDGAITTAGLDDEMYVGWNDEVAILMSGMVRREARNEEAHIDTVGGMPMNTPSMNWEEEVPDAEGSRAELTAMLQPVKGSGLDQDQRFRRLEKDGHDISLWVGYDALLQQYYANPDEGSNMLSATVAEMLLKGSAMATGIDFQKGQIEGLMRYYAADSLQEVARQFGKQNVDADMLRRLPAPGLNLAAALHLSPAVVKLLLQRLNLSGMANLALMSQGITLDDVLGGFTGDMVLALNNFKVSKDSAATPGSIEAALSNLPSVDFVAAMKIGDKTKLEKLIALASGGDVLQPAGPNTYHLGGDSRASLVVGDKYIAVSSNQAFAEAFLREHAGAMPDAVHKELNSHPAGCWVDLQSLLQGALQAADGSDAARLKEVAMVLQSLSINGGEMRDGANEYRLKMRFTDPKENSLLQLLHLAQRVAQIESLEQQQQMP